jgi:NADPH:quinone reductase-like Zn-dependent oxidoreductase
MRAVRIHTQAGPDALVVEEAPYPHTAENDVVIRVHAAGFTPGELDWPGTWKDLAGRDRCPVIPGHEVSGEVAELGMGTTGLTAAAASDEVHRLTGCSPTLLLPLEGERPYSRSAWSDCRLLRGQEEGCRRRGGQPDHIVRSARPIAGRTRSRRSLRIR